MRLPSGVRQGAKLSPRRDGAGVGGMGRSQRVLGTAVRRAPVLPHQLRRALLLLFRAALVLSLLEPGRALGQLHLVIEGGISRGTQRCRLIAGEAVPIAS